MQGGDLKRLDVALLALRRFVDAPSPRGDSTLVHDRVHDSARIEVSTVLVVDAVARRGAGGECSIGAVAEELRVVHSTASRLIDRAVRAGMLHRTRSSADPRRVVLTLSAAGEQLQREAIAFRTGRLAELLVAWSDDEVTTFTRLLERFARSARPLKEQKP